MRWHSPYQLNLPLGLPESPYVLPFRTTGRFVVKEHYASRHHFDFRLEIDGVLKSWVILESPDLSAKYKAIRVADHSMRGLLAQGRIRSGYGAGTISRWDYGQFLCLNGDPMEALRQGRLRFVLYGDRLDGTWELRRTKSGWELVKISDEWIWPDDAIIS